MKGIFFTEEKSGLNSLPLHFISSSFFSTWTWSLLMSPVALTPSLSLIWHLELKHTCPLGAQTLCRSAVPVRDSCQARNNRDECTCEYCSFCLHQQEAPQLLLTFPPKWTDCLLFILHYFLASLVVTNLCWPKWWFLHFCTYNRNKSQMNITSLMD